MDSILCPALLIIAVLIIMAMAKRSRDAFNERFPPISDAEFLARCRPGTSPQVALKVRRLVAEHLAIEYERVYPSTDFVEDLGAD